MKTNTRIDALVPWRPDIAELSPMFAPLAPLLARFSDFEQWPGLADLQALFDELPEPICTLGGQPLSLVPQGEDPDYFDGYYAPRIYATGEIQTRTNNWHDFFQFLTWFIFPRTKAVINAIHIPLARERFAAGEGMGRRTPVENTLSLFDEGGAVLVSCDESLLQLVRDFKWKELFWQRRDDLKEKFDCITFGHAMYEKGMCPYLGMTANTILLRVEKSYFSLPQAEQLAHMDERLAAIVDTGEQFQKPRDLQPFPILGMPGWDAANRDESYYDNTNYFRPGRRKG